MSLRVNHNTAAINAHRNLLQNTTAANKTLEKLSSGLKVNRAADGPATLVISEQMRGQISGLTQAIDNSEVGVSMVQTMEANLQEISNQLISMRQLAVHASNEGVNDETMLQADQDELNNSLDTITRIATQAQFGNKRLLDGSNGASGSTTGEALSFVGANLKTRDSAEKGFDVKITQNAAKASVTGTAALTDEMVQGGETLTIIENGKTANYTTRADDTLQTAFKNFSSEMKKNGLNVDATMSETGVMTLTHKEYGSGNRFQVSSSTAGLLSQTAGEIEVSKEGLDVKGTINGESATGKGQILRGIDGAENVDGLQVKIAGKIGGEEGIPDDGQGIAVGRVYVSQNSLNFQVGANHGQTVGISVDSIRADNMATNVDNESGYGSLADVDVRNFQGAQDAIKMIDDAVTAVAAKRGEIGAFQKNTLESNLNNLRVANENLISSESVLRDTDMAAEMATYTKTQIMSQAATAMLAQANQSPRSVLELLG
ncbi:MAG: flagellin [SAR324 cluster bacterium]|nr:flagellin [SAR324 cluster bacterium]